MTKKESFYSMVSLIIGVFLTLLLFQFIYDYVGDAEEKKEAYRLLQLREDLREDLRDLRNDTKELIKNSENHTKVLIKSAENNIVSALNSAMDDKLETHVSTYHDKP